METRQATLQEMFHVKQCAQKQIDEKQSGQNFAESTNETTPSRRPLNATAGPCRVASHRQLRVFHVKHSLSQTWSRSQSQCLCSSEQQPEQQPVPIAIDSLAQDRSRLGQTDCSAQDAKGRSQVPRPRPEREPRRSCTASTTARIGTATPTTQTTARRIAGRDVTQLRALAERGSQ